jgi:hypothetical protein
MYDTSFMKSGEQEKDAGAFITSNIKLQISNAYDSILDEQNRTAAGRRKSTTVDE